MSDLAARLAERARPSAEAPTMVPYLPDRPADPRIAPESSLAEFGGFGGSDGDEPSLALDDPPWVPASEPGPDLRALLAGAHRGASEPARTLASAPVSLSRDAAGDRRLAPPLDVTPVAERMVERTDGDAPRIQPATRSPTLDGFTLSAPATLSSERSIEPQASAPEPLSDSLHPAAAPRPPRELQAVLMPAQGPAEALSRALSVESTLADRPPDEARPTHPATSTALLPTPPSLLPRERPVALDEPILPPEAPTIHIGDITVEVVQASPRAEARRVQAPQERPRRSAAATTSTPGSSRPLRTFGLRQL